MRPAFRPISPNPPARNRRPVVIKKRKGTVVIMPGLTKTPGFEPETGAPPVNHEAAERAVFA